MSQDCGETAHGVERKREPGTEGDGDRIEPEELQPMPVVMVMAWAIQKLLGVAIALAHALPVEGIVTSRAGAESMIMAPSAPRDQREDADADASESARRSRHC